MTIEKFKIKMRYWTNKEILKYKTTDNAEIEALNAEIGYRVKRDNLK